MTPGVSVGDGLFFLHGGYQCVTHWQMNEWDNVVDGHQAIEPCAVLSRNYGLDDQRGTLALVIRLRRLGLWSTAIHFALPTLVGTII